jgi:hypothetical protein
MKTLIAKKVQRVHPKTKASQMPRVILGGTKGIISFTDRCQDEVGRIMKKVPSPEESQMPAAHSELSEQDKEQIKGAHLGEATETLAKTMFISGARGALKSVLVKQNRTGLKEGIQIGMQMEQKWMQIKLLKAKIQKLADMEDHELQQSQQMESHTNRQVNQ